MRLLPLAKLIKFEFLLTDFNGFRILKRILFLETDFRNLLLSNLPPCICKYPTLLYNIMRSPSVIQQLQCHNTPDYPSRGGEFSKINSRTTATSG